MIATLTTDFGNRDGFVGVMKGVILGFAPESTLVDITHEVPAHDIASGAWVLSNSYSFFPRGTIHLAIVDPGVGSQRRALIVRTRDHTFVAPDNGVLSRVLDSVTAADCFWINEPRFWRKNVSTTFHGRDVFAPVVGHLLSGKGPEAVGAEVDFSTLIRLPAWPLDVQGKQVTMTVAYVDRFGNLITNAPASMFESVRYLSINSHAIQLGETYASVPPGSAVAYVGSHGFIEIGVNLGRADTLLHAPIGTPVTVELS